MGESQIAVSITGYTSVRKGESHLRAALNKGPVSVCLCSDTWQDYSGGILRSCGTQSDHCVQATGYGPGYWNIRNSWGPDWGEEGYIRLAVGSDLCGVADDTTFPTF